MFEEMSLKLSQSFAFFRSLGLFDDKKETSGAKQEASPTLKVQTDKEIYRPGDSVTATIEICSPISSKEDTEKEDYSSLLIENVTFEVKGIEKLDTQWFSTQKPLPGSKQRRGILFLPPNVLDGSYSITKIFLVRNLKNICKISVSPYPLFC